MAKKSKPKATNARSQWTVMVYMAAGDDDRLDNLAISDLREMERGSRGNDYVHVVVQINRAWPSFPQRYWIHDGKSEFVKEDSKHTDMGEGATLEAFLEWVVGYENCRANNYLLVLWGHAYGLGFGRDHDDPLTLKELRNALRKFSGWRRGNKLELLGANACAMSYVEAAFELKDSADYLVASEIAVPFAGWPYESILRAINENTEPKQLGRIIVDYYVNHFASSASDKHVSMTLLNLVRAEDLGTQVSRLAVELKKAVFSAEGATNDRLTHVRDVFRATTAGDVRPLIDFSDLCEGLVDLFKDLRTLEPQNVSIGADAASAINSTYAADDAAKTLLSTLKAADERRGLASLPSADAPTREKKKLASSARPKGPQDPFVLYHNRHPELEGLHGVGIFAPFVTNADDLKRLGLSDRGDEKATTTLGKLNEGQEAYESLSLFGKPVAKPGQPAGEPGQGLEWPKLVYEVLHQEISPEVWSSIDGTGATSAADRAGITQMLVAVDSAFNKLERTLRAAQQKIRVTLEPLKNIAASKSGVDLSDLVKSITLFGPPFLKLIRPDLIGALKAETTRKKHLKQNIANALGVSSLGTADVLETVVGSFNGLEKAVQEVERATRRMLTDASFGLGPPGKADSFGPKNAGDILGPKNAGDILGPKNAGDILGPKNAGDILGAKNAGDILGAKNAGDIFGAKNAGDILGPKNAGDILGFSAGAMGGINFVARSWESSVLELFGQVGAVMLRLEQAVAGAETTAAGVLTIPTFGVGLVPERRVKAAITEIDEAFRMLEETAGSARRAVQSVLADPVYGLGPGSKDLGAATRRQFAEAAGLGRLQLRLL